MAAAAPAAHCLVPDSTVLGPEMTGSSLPTCLPADAPWTGRPAAHLLCPGSVVGSLCGAASSETWSRPPLCPLAIKVQTCGRSKWPVGRGRGEQGLHQGSRRDPSPAGRSFGEAGRSPARLFPAPPPHGPCSPLPRHRSTRIPGSAGAHGAEARRGVLLPRSRRMESTHRSKGATRIHNPTIPPPPAPENS